MAKWMLVSSVAVVIAIGGLVYYLFVKSPADTAAAPLQVVVQPEQRSGNPLLTATVEQFDRWFPTHCQADLYFRPTTNAHTRDVCIVNVTKRVETGTGVRLTRDDILNPAVIKHWKQVAGVQ